MYLRKLPSGKWQATFRDPAGRRRTMTFATKAAARSWGADREADIRRGAYIDPHAGRITLREWHDRWWAARVVEPTTAKKNRSHLDVHVLPHFAAWPLDAITRLEVQGWVRGMQKAGVGPATIQACRNILVTILKAAVDEDLLRANAAQGVVVPTLPRKPMRVLSLAEVDHLLAAHVEPYRTLWELAAFTGLRWGELTGLHVHRLDLLHKRLHVVEVMERGGRVKPYPKSSGSQRIVPLPPRVVDSLAALLKDHPREGLVFGRLDYSHTRSRVWLPGLVKARLADPQPTIHDLRHSCATNLLAAGVGVREVMAILGHTQLATTLRYSHTDEERTAAAMLRAWL